MSAWRLCYFMWLGSNGTRCVSSRDRWQANIPWEYMPPLQRDTNVLELPWCLRKAHSHSVWERNRFTFWAGSCISPKGNAELPVCLAPDSSPQQKQQYVDHGQLPLLLQLVIPWMIWFNQLRPLRITYYSRGGRLVELKFQLLVSTNTLTMSMGCGALGGKISQYNSFRGFWVCWKNKFVTKTLQGATLPCILPLASHPSQFKRKGKRKELRIHLSLAWLLREEGKGGITYVTPSSQVLVMRFNQPYHRKQKGIASFSTTLSSTTRLCIEKVQSELKTVTVHNDGMVQFLLSNLQCKYIYKKKTVEKKPDVGKSNLLNSTIYYHDNLKNLCVEQ